jgi:hypothetical protein
VERISNFISSISNRPKTYFLEWITDPFLRKILILKYKGVKKEKWSKVIQNPPVMESLENSFIRENPVFRLRNNTLESYLISIPMSIFCGLPISMRSVRVRNINVPCLYSGNDPKSSEVRFHETQTDEFRDLLISISLISQ